jgi:hypothetical protein
VQHESAPRIVSNSHAHRSILRGHTHTHMYNMGMRTHRWTAERSRPRGPRYCSSARSALRRVSADNAKKREVVPDGLPATNVMSPTRRKLILQAKVVVAKPFE